VKEASLYIRSGSVPRKVQLNFCCFAEKMKKAKKMDNNVEEVVGNVDDGLPEEEAGSQTDITPFSEDSVTKCKYILCVTF
jgi:hypothetical protein